MNIVAISGGEIRLREALEIDTFIRPLEVTRLKIKKGEDNRMTDILRLFK